MTEDKASPLAYAVSGPDASSRYLYDTATNRLLKVGQKLLDHLDAKHVGGSCAQCDDANEQIARLREKYGILSTERVQNMAPCYSPAEAQHLIDHHLGQLTIELTEQCNLRCNYCQFTHGPAECRSHGRRSMPIGLVRAGIDYLVAHSSHSERRALGFYGGEPLLAVSEILAAVSQLDKHGVEAHLTITSNGTVPFSVLQSLIPDRDVSLLVSLDGPQDEHDRHRRFANGRGCFSTVMTNLEKLAESDPGYYERSVGANCVLTPSADLLALREFFEKNEVVRSLRVQVSGMSAHEGCWDVPRHPCRKDQYRVLEEEYVSRLQRGETPSKFLRALFDTTFVRFFKRNIYSGFEGTTGVGGMCLPGFRKLFADVEGTLHACERVERTRFLGHLETGVEYERVRALIDAQIDLCEDHCPSCWCLRLCSACWAGLSSGVGTTEARRSGYCRTIRSHFGAVLVNVARVLESNPNGFDWCADISLT